MMHQQLTSREKKLAVAVVTAAVLFGGAAFVVHPMLNYHAELSDRVRTTEAKLIKSLKLLRQEEKINADYNTLSAQYQCKGTDEEMVSTLLQSLESIGRTSSITITDIKPRPRQDPAAKSASKTYFIEMDVESSMPNLFRFLREMESANGFFSVLKLNIAPKGRDSKTLRAYILVSRTVWL